MGCGSSDGDKSPRTIGNRLASSKGLSAVALPRTYMDISIGGKSVGRLVFELRSDITPLTCENFRALCEGSRGAELSYKGTLFHRIVPGFMCHGGDTTANDGSGGKSIYGNVFPDENFTLPHTKYGLCMANAGKNQNSSQFFISLCVTDWLSGINCCFGQVIEGFDVLEKMSRVGGKDGAVSERVIVDNCGEIYINPP